MKAKTLLVQLCVMGIVVLHGLTSEAQPVIRVAAGSQHTLFIKGDGSLWGMGDNLGVSWAAEQTRTSSGPYRFFLER